MWTKISIFFSVFFALIETVVNVFAQQVKIDPSKAISQYNISYYSVDEGLPGRGALALVQSADGYLFIATYNGLVQFDGLTMTVHSSANNPSIENNSIESLYIDEDSSLWIGTFDGLILKKNEIWKLFSTKNGLPSNLVESVVRDQKHNLWIGTVNGLCLFKDSTFIQDGVPNELKGITIKQIFEDNLGRIWIATGERGLYYFQKNDLHNYCQEAGLTEVNDVKSICEDHNGQIWFASRHGLFRIARNGTYTRFSVDDGLPSNVIKSVFCDSQGLLWVGSEMGLSKYYQGKFTSFIESKEFEKNNVTDILEDFEGNIWVSTYDYGIYGLKGSKFTSFTEAEGLNSKVIYAIIEEPDRSLLIASQKGITQFDGKKFLDYVPAIPLPNKTVRDIMRDSHGILWVCSEDGLLKLDGKNSKLFTIENGLSDNYVRITYEDKDHNIWIGSKNGLMKYSDEIFTVFTREDGLTNDFILSVFQDSKGNLWIGTRDGLSMIDSYGIHKYFVVDGLAGNTIFKIHEDREGVLWICSNGGLSCLSGDKFISFNGSGSHVANSVFHIVEDNKGTFWMPCNNGIITARRSDLIDFANGKINFVPDQLYTKDDGLKESQCVGNSKSCMDMSGTIWFPTYYGIVSINPDSLKMNLIPPITKIEQLIVDKIEIPLEKVVIIPPDKQRIEIRFTAISFTSPENIRLSYQLKGFDREWQEAGNNREAEYTNLHPGTYQFKVKSCNNDGIWNETPVGFQIVKETFFYQTIWFYILIVACFILFASTIYIWRIRAFRKKNAELEILVKLRTAEILMQKEEIQSQAENLTLINKDIIAQNTEITQQKEEMQSQAEQLAIINKELEKLSIVASETESSVVIADHEGNLEWVNKGFTRMYGYTLEEFIAQKGANLIGASDNPNMKDAIRKCIDQKTAVIYSLPTLTREGASIWVQTTLSPILDANGNIAKLVAIDSNISKLKEQEQLINIEKEKSDNLLLNILPYETAKELKEKGFATPRHYKKVSVLFTDFEGFTKSVEKMTPQELVNDLHTYFAMFDDIIESHFIEKIKTIGDAYMCAGGLPIRNNSNPIDTVLAALGIRQFMIEVNKERESKGLNIWKLRCGIHTGGVISGVVGKKKFAYDIWGDTVNIASRMESSGAVGKINISESTYLEVREYFDCEYRGKIDAKNKGKINMYFVSGIKKEYVHNKFEHLPNTEFLKILSKV